MPAKTEECTITADLGNSALSTLFVDRSAEDLVSEINSGKRMIHAKRGSLGESWINVDTIKHVQDGRREMTS